MISTGRIYKIINRFDNDVYIGSTFNTIKHRWQNHKRDYNSWLNGKHNKCSIYEKFKLLGIDNFKIMLIKEYQVYREHKKDHKHLLVYEQLWINKIKCVNSQCAFNPIPKKERDKLYNKNNKEKIKEKDKQYRLNNKEKKKETNKQYKLKNKDKLNKKFNCSCGGKYQHRNKSAHVKTKIHMKYMNNI